MRKQYPSFNPHRISSLLLLILLCSTFLLLPFPVPAAQVQLAWDPSPAPDVRGYKVYYGVASRSYSYTVDVGLATSCLVGGLQEGTRYYFTTTAYNAQLESVYSNEVSYPGPDTTPPAVSSTSPANLATGVAVNTAINAVFTEAMDPATITASTFTLKAGSTSLSGTFSYTGTTATFTPSGSLAYNTNYAATITTGARDLAGNALASAYSWSFTTGPAPDTTRPTVSSTSPANLAIGVGINTAINAVFSEAMDPATITASTFTLKAGSTSLNGAVSYSGTTGTFTPASALAYNTTYTATISTGARDLAGNALLSAYTWSFTTGPAPDTTRPTVSSTTPANGATGVAINRAISATFSEAMDPSTITTATFTLKAGTTSITGTVSYTGTTGTFTPASALAYNTTYTATISTGARDLAGNALLSAYTWSFTTGPAPDTTPPTVSSTIPVHGTATVAVRTTIRATFSEAMDPSTITTATFTLQAGSTPISGTVSYSGTTATFTPSRALAYNTTYTATISMGAKDLAGNALASAYYWSFTTQSRSKRK